MEKPTDSNNLSSSPSSSSPSSSSPSSSSPSSSSSIEKKLPATPLRCFTGALTAGTFSLLAYRLTLSIATSFANKPVTSDNPAVVNISAAVRTLVTGMVALGAGVFGIAALGLAALGIQILIKKATGTQADALGESGSSES